MLHIAHYTSFWKYCLWNVSRRVFERMTHACQSLSQMPLSAQSALRTWTNSTKIKHYIATHKHNRKKIQVSCKFHSEESSWGSGCRRAFVSRDQSYLDNVLMPMRPCCMLLQLLTLPRQIRPLRNEMPPVLCSHSWSSWQTWTRYTHIQTTKMPLQASGCWPSETSTVFITCLLNWCNCGPR